MRYEAHTQATGEGRKPMVEADGTKVVYEGYMLVSDYDTFWSNGTYQKYFLPLIQNSCTTEDITKMENGDGSVLEADLPVLIESIPWGSWVRGEDLVREETTQEMITRAYYRYCGPEGKKFQGNAIIWMKWISLRGSVEKQKSSGNPYFKNIWKMGMVCFPMGNGGSLKVRA